MSGSGARVRQLKAAADSLRNANKGHEQLPGFFAPLRVTKQENGIRDKRTQSVAGPVEPEATLGEERRAEREVGGAGDLRALIGDVVQEQGGGPAVAEVVAGEDPDGHEGVQLKIVGT